MVDAPAVLDRYQDAGFGWRRTILLRADTVECQATDRFGRPLSRSNARLCDLMSTPRRTWHKDERRYTWALACVGLAIPVGAILLFWLNVTNAAWLSFAVVSVLVLAGITGAAVLFPRRVEYVWFLYQSGATAFAFGKSGPEATKFEAFVGALETRISEVVERRRLTTA